jgi:YNFM family putative membrane transporter
MLQELACARRPLRYGEAGMGRVRLGLFAAGLATFALLYTVQPLLPQLAASFHISPAGASLAMSAGTGALALAVIPVSSLSEAFGRRRVMIVSVLAASLLGLIVPLSPSFAVLVLLRILQGFALAGVPAVAMAYLTEEVDRGSLGRAMGMLVGGNAIGGLTGRIGAGALTDIGGWRLAVLGVSGFALVCALFITLLPASSFFTPVRFRFGVLVASLGANIRDLGLVRLYVIGFALMGAFVTVYNYLTFRLSGRPFFLSATVIGSLFVVYLAGTFSSSLAGRLADRFGRYLVMLAGFVVFFGGVLLTVPSTLAVIVLGLMVMTGGFFAAHSVASGWIGARARVAPAQASALYLCAYYIGSSAAGSVGGVFYGSGGWDSTVVFVVVLLLVGLGCAVSMRFARPTRLSDPAPGTAGSRRATSTQK